MNRCIATKLEPIRSDGVLPWVLERSVVILDKRAFLAQIATCITEKSAAESATR